ncbi:MAG: FtsX-like permease family protein [Clostridiales bacterium]|nr:FtsX-like permease family protein [Clostridiales bacterium]
MKKTKWKHLLRTIKKNGVSFFAVSFIAATSIAIFLGLQSSGTAILKAANRYYINNKLETLEITCANGITEEDIEAIATWEGVDLVEGGYTTSVLMDGEEEKIILQALSLCSEMNEATVIEGTLPAASDEVAVEEIFAEEQGIQVGDVITLEHDGELLSDTFEVTAIVNMPYFCCASLQDARGTGDVGLGSASYYITLSLEAFDSSYYDDCYTTAYVRSNALDDYYYYSTAYTEQETALKEMVEELGAERAELRYQLISEEAESEIADAQAEIDDGQAEIDEAESEIADGEQEIADAEVEIAEGESEIADAEVEIADAEVELADAEVEVAEAESEIAEAESEINSAQSQIDDGQVQIDAAQAEIDTAQAQLDAAQEELQSGWEQAASQQIALDAALNDILTQLLAFGIETGDLDEALEQLAAYGDAAAPLTEAITQYQESKALLEASMVTLADSAAEIKTSEAELAKSRSELSLKKAELSTSVQQLEEKKEELADAKAELADAKAELEDKKAKLEDANDELADKQPELEDAKADLEDAKAELEEAKADLAEAKEELEDARVELADAEEEAADIELKDWIVSVRNDVGDIHGVKTIVESIYGLSYSMSIIFLLVALVVCYSAITRMIDEQRALIGAQKALGFQSGEILRHYMLYNALCAICGILHGFCTSVIIVEILVLHIFTPKFLLGSVPMIFAWKSTLLAAAICMVIFLTATYTACAKLVRQPATTLLRGEVPVQGKPFFFENWKPYKKLSLYSRTMIKNVLSDKGRMMTTIMGVVGCIALLVICFALKMGIENSSVVQFKQYFFYENRLVVDSEAGSVEEFAEILDEAGISYTMIQDNLKNFRVDGGSWDSTHIVAVDDFDELSDYMYLEDIDTKEAADVPENGILISRKCAENNDLSAGDTVEMMDSEGNAKEFTVVGVIEHYLAYNLFVTTTEYYEETMGEETDACVFLLKGDIDGLYEQVRDVDGFLSLKDNSEFDADASSVNLVIMICLALSAVMALLVLLNQIVMHINRKARELAVMRINGYTLKETRAYVYKDNIILTILGLILGSGFGALLSYIIIQIIESGASRYVRIPNIRALIYASVVGAVFALIVNLIALRKIKTLNLTNVSEN